VDRKDTENLQAGLLRILDDFAGSNGLSITDESTLQSLLAEVETTLDSARENPIKLYGFRAQSMFAYLAAAMGHCQVITE